MKIIKNTLKVIAILALLDIMVVITGMAQIGIEGRIGEWNTFWATQAKFIIGLLS